MDLNNNISVSIKLHPSLTQYKPEDSDSLQFDRMIPGESTILELLTILSIPDDTIKMISLNDKLVKAEETLSDGDRLILFSTIAGG